MTKSTESTIGAAVAFHRKRQGLRQRDLAERLARLGDGALGDAQTVSKIERGLRGVGLDEWLLLASALLVPPLALLFPYEVEGVDTPLGSTISPHWGWEWLTGEAPGPSGQQRRSRLTDGDTSWREGTYRVEQQREVAERRQQIIDAYNQQHAAQQREDTDEANERRVAALAELAELREQAEALDMAPVLNFEDDALNVEAVDMAATPEGSRAGRNIRLRIAKRALDEAEAGLDAATERRKAASKRFMELCEQEGGR